MRNKYHSGPYRTTRFGAWILVACALIVSQAAMISAPQRTSRSRKPNIIVILADDLGFGDLGVYGQKYIRTPNLDRMAQDGIRFTQFYASCALCAPSSAS